MLSTKWYRWVENSNVPQSKGSSIENTKGNKMEKECGVQGKKIADDLHIPVV